MKNWGFGGERSDFIVIVALAIYCTLFGFIFGTMAANNSCRTSLMGCLPTWIKDYQTLLATAAVIFTIAVAKQQLDANRRQHELTVRRSFRNENEALKSARKIAEVIQATNLFTLRQDQGYGKKIVIYVPSRNYIEDIEKYAHSEVAYYSRKLFDIAHQVMELSDDQKNDDKVQRILLGASLDATTLINTIDHYEKEIESFYT